MFSTRPSVGCRALVNIRIARRVSASETCCGVVTTIDPTTGDRLAEAERNVAGSRRHVHNEIVEVLPGHFPEELLNRAVQHRAPPDQPARRRRVRKPIETT